jgi:hypothetical protein
LEESPREFALYLFEALDDFFATHYFFENYTIESLRYVDVISELKAFL